MKNYFSTSLHNSEAKQDLDLKFSPEVVREYRRLEAKFELKDDYTPPAPTSQMSNKLGQSLLLKVGLGGKAATKSAVTSQVEEPQT